MDDFSIVMTSRGCPYACGFCGSGNMWRRTVRYRPVEKVVEEVEFLKNKYHVEADFKPFVSSSQNFENGLKSYELGFILKKI